MYNVVIIYLLSCAFYDISEETAHPFTSKALIKDEK